MALRMIQMLTVYPVSPEEDFRNYLREMEIVLRSHDIRLEWFDRPLLTDRHPFDNVDTTSLMTRADNIPDPKDNKEVYASTTYRLAIDYGRTYTHSMSCLFLTKKDAAFMDLPKQSRDAVQELWRCVTNASELHEGTNPYLMFRNMLRHLWLEKREVFHPAFLSWLSELSEISRISQEVIYEVMTGCLCFQRDYNNRSYGFQDFATFKFDTKGSLNDWNTFITGVWGDPDKRRALNVLMLLKFKHSFSHIIGDSLPPMFFPEHDGEASFVSWFVPECVPELLSNRYTTPAPYTRHRHLADGQILTSNLVNCGKWFYLGSTINPFEFDDD